MNPLSGEEDHPEVYRISPASSADLHDQAAGQVTQSELFQPRSLRPHFHGLFCDSLFGRPGQWECLCGSRRWAERAGQVCGDCGMPVQYLRAARFGFIELGTPAVHPWFTRELALLLNYTPRAFRQLLHSQYHAVIETGDSPFRVGTLLSEDELRQASAYGNGFEVATGALACRRLLERMNLLNLAHRLQQRLARGGLTARLRRHVQRRLHLLRLIRQAAPDDPDGWAARLVIDRVPVLPPEQRLPPALGGNRATDSINTVYRVLINHAIRLGRLEALKAPEVIIRNEHRLIQHTVHALYGCQAIRTPILGDGVLRRAQAGDRLRRLVVPHLLNRWVDYSGRAIAVADPGLTRNQCGLPLRMAVELFRPFLLLHVAEHSPAPRAERAAQLIALFRPPRRGWRPDLFLASQRMYRELLLDLAEDLWTSLSAVVNGRRILVTRGAVLRALEPVVVPDEAVHLHPEIAQVLGITFSGEMVNLHLPLSREAQTEAAVLLTPAMLDRKQDRGENGQIPEPAPCPPPARARELFAAVRKVRHQRFQEQMRQRAILGFQRKLVAVGQRVVVRMRDCLITGDAEEESPASAVRLGRNVPPGRSPLTCQARAGICQRCYGVDPDTGQLVEQGTPVGLRAALALGATLTRLPLDGWEKHLARLEALFEGRVQAWDADLGQPVPRTTALRHRTRHEVAQALLELLRQAYAAQSIAVDARHLEVIVSQMVRHDERGRVRLEGVTATIQREGFLTALTVLDPVAVLRRAALRGAEEEPIGLHLDALSGLPIPAGTGWHACRNE